MPDPDEYHCPKCGAAADERFDCCEVRKMTSTDPIHNEGESWYFWNESWSIQHGPYSSREAAETQLNKYVKHLG